MGGHHILRAGSVGTVESDIPSVDVIYFWYKLTTDKLLNTRQETDFDV